MENKEPLETGTVVGKFSDAIENVIDNFFTNGIVTTRVVIGCILLAGDELFRVIETLVFPLAN